MYFLLPYIICDSEIKNKEQDANKETRWNFKYNQKKVFFFDIPCIVIKLTKPFHKENIICFD